MDLIKEMLPPEQAAMFDTYNTMFQGMDFSGMDFSGMDFMNQGMGQAFSQARKDKEE